MNKRGGQELIREDSSSDGADTTNTLEVVNPAESSLPMSEIHPSSGTVTISNAKGVRGQSYTELTQRPSCPGPCVKCEELVAKQSPMRILITLLLLSLLCIGLLISTIVLSIQNSNHSDGDDSSKQENNGDNSNTIKQPRNLIIFIGDGMSPNVNRALQLFSGVNSTQLDRHFVGRYSTRSASQTVTDSANGAFAFAAGGLTNNGFIGVDPAGNPRANLMEAAKLARGMGVGIVTTARVTDATPASFYAHSLVRNWQNLIAKQLGDVNFVTNETDASQEGSLMQSSIMVDLCFGGGYSYFIPQNMNISHRKDYWDIREDYLEKGWQSLIIKNRNDLMDLTVDDLPSLALLADDDLPYYIDRRNDQNQVSLMDMTKKSLQLLSVKYGNDDQPGFVLMIESAKIDKCMHPNDGPCALREMEETDDTLKYLFEWLQNEDNEIGQQSTMVVLADHGTGGLTLGRSLNLHASDVIPFQNGDAPRKQNISQFTQSFDYDDLNYPIKEHLGEQGMVSLYQWRPQALKSVNHSSSFMVDEILEKAKQMSNDDEQMTLDELCAMIEVFLGFPLSMIERGWLNDTMYKMPQFGYMSDEDQRRYAEENAQFGLPLALQWTLTTITSVRSVTGWTTHGHSGVDIPISAYGPGSEQFRGTHTNYGVGQKMATLLGLKQAQESFTEQVLKPRYLSGKLRICDSTDPLKFYKWDTNVSLPSDNWRYEVENHFCVHSYHS